MRTFILVTLDSCRWDTFVAAETPFFDALGTALPGRSHGDWTVPGHKAIFAGSLPHSTALPGKRPVFAPWMTKWFKERDYLCYGAASVPYLHRLFGFGQDFDAYKAVASDLGKMELVPLRENLDYLLGLMSSQEDRNFFLFLNVGETHYPYWHEGQPKQRWHDGNILTQLLWSYSEHQLNFEEQLFRDMHRAQIEQVEWVDGMLAQWSEHLPGDAVWFITADHGELFGEHHLCGHGHGSYPEEISVPVLCSDWEWIYQYRGGK